MKLLTSSADFDDLQRVVKRLVCAFIPCAVCKDPGSSRLSVWIQQDHDFPLALHAVMNREERARLPHWSRALEASLPTNQRSAFPVTNGIEPPRELVDQSKRTTWTSTAHARYMACMPQGIRTPLPPAWPAPSPYIPGDTPVDDEELASAAKFLWDYGVKIEQGGR
jgi:hypothetical protein